MKILFVIENLYFGGGERAFAQIINGLDKEKFEIYIACQEGGIFGERIKNYGRILPFSMRNKFSLLAVTRLIKIIKEKNIQIVHSQGSRADFFARIAAGIADASVISTVALPIEKYNDVSLLRKSIYVMLSRFSERFVDKFVVVSDSLRRRFIEKHRIPPEKVIRIYNGIEVEGYFNEPKSVSKIRSKFSLKPDTKLVGAIGRLVWQKGTDYFIRAIKQIVENKRRLAEKTKFLIVGEGDKRKSLERLATKLGIGKNIIFTGFRKDVKEILQALDIFILPSLSEGQPMVLLEAMAMGKPAIVTNIEGIDETAIDGITGMFVPPRDPLALSKAIICLLENPKKAQEIGEAARRIAAEKFNIKDKIKQYDKLYEEIAATKY